MSFVDHPNIAFTLLDPEQFETIERYKPGPEFRELLEGIVPADWTVLPHGYWTHCDPPREHTLVHGWKIHVSSKMTNARETLTLVAKVCVDLDIAFKFCSDEWMLELSFNKNASRSQVGKFVTVFPRDIDEFRRCIERIHAVTTHLEGPYILTDRPYRDSRVVFYRYGEHRGDFRLNRFGHRLPGFDLNGHWVSDSRAPMFRLPPGVVDPFDDSRELKAPGEGGVLLKGRYRLTGALKFSAIGGIYFGIDELTGMDIVVREVRSSLGLLSRERNPADALHKEADVLRRLGPTGYVPLFVDIFKEWENDFLVQEKVDAESLWSNAMGYYFAYAGQTRDDCFQRIQTAALRIAEAIDAVHEAGVVLRDITRTNVMITPEGGVKFIDFEFAHALADSGPWVHGWTPGYGAPEQRANAAPAPSDDAYAFGVLLLDMLTFCSSGFELNRDGLYRRLRMNLDDLGLPRALEDLVVGLTRKGRSERTTMTEAIQALRSMTTDGADRSIFNVSGEFPDFPSADGSLRDELSGLLRGIHTHLKDTLTLERNDRLWPCSADLFATNPVNMQHGAAGPALFLLRRDGHVDARILDWIAARSANRSVPAGLYSGLAGVALLFLEAGDIERSAEIMRRGADSPTIHESHGLYFGAAGWGLACLHLWRATGENRYLQDALAIGEHLLASSQDDERGTYWSESSGKVPLGLGEGQSGVALFMTYLARAANAPSFLDTAMRAIDFDYAHGVDSAGRILLHTAADSKPGDPKSPHTWYGSAGIGIAALRCRAAGGHIRFADMAERIALCMSSRFTNKLWQFEGVAGFGEYLLDMNKFTSDQRYLHAAYHQAAGLLPHAIPRDNGGVAFAGMDHFRICSDFSEGAAGIGLFVDRLLHERSRLFMLDELLH